MPLVRVTYTTVCKEVVIPDKNGKPVGGITCKEIPLGSRPPPGYSRDPQVGSVSYEVYVDGVPRVLTKRFAKTRRFHVPGGLSKITWTLQDATDGPLILNIGGAPVRAVAVQVGDGHLLIPADAVSDAIDSCEREGLCPPKESAVENCNTGTSGGFNVGQVMLYLCTYLLSPKSLLEKLSGKRDRYIPDKNTAPSNIIAALAPQATSTALVLSDDKIARTFVFDEIILDAGTNFSDLIVNVLVGTRVEAELSGQQINPDTNNPCVSRAMCGLSVCAGSEENVNITVTNISAAALGVAASIRVHGRVYFPGDKQFQDCWQCQCDDSGLSTIMTKCGCEKPVG